MNIKRNPISARNMVFFFIITTRLCPSVRLSVRPSVYYALSSLTIGRNPTKCARFSYEWGVRQHFFLDHPPGAPGRVQRSTIRFEKSISKILYQTLCLFSKIKRWNFRYVAWVILQGVGLGVACGSISFSKHGRVAYQIEGDGEQNGEQVKCSP